MLNRIPMLLLLVVLLLPGCEIKKAETKPPQKEVKPPNKTGGVFIPAEQTNQDFIEPGVTGLYDELRKIKIPEGTIKLKPYVKYRDIETPADEHACNIHQIVVKFIEGSNIRIVDEQVRKLPSDKRTYKRLSYWDVGEQEIQGLTKMFSEKLKTVKGRIQRANIYVPDEDLELAWRHAEVNTQQELPDPNSYAFVYLPLSVTGEQALDILKIIRQFKIVELAYFQPTPFNAADIPPTTVINVAPFQSYFQPAPLGIDVDFARNFRGSRGEGVKIADIETGWLLNHEDFPRIAFHFGVNLTGHDHGAAVIGIIAAEENGFGATGIVPNSTVGWSSASSFIPGEPFYPYSVGGALFSSARALGSGDIALIEQHFIDLLASFICTPATDPCGCNSGAPGSCCPTPPCTPCSCAPCADEPFVIVETYPYEHTAIRILTGAGIIVVEAAGNGRTLVTPASTVDSGAIVVGAANSDHVPMCWSNFGPRVNVHAWGTGVATLGYGDTPALRANGADADQWYTRSFNGTSSASPIVVGAAAIIQSMRMNIGLPRLNPLEMRTLLVSTGTPQFAGSTPNIGPMPDLRRAIATFRPDVATWVDQTNLLYRQVTPSAQLIFQVTFQNNGGVAWIGNHSISLSPTSAANFTATPASMPAGSSADNVNPGERVGARFQLTAPSRTGTYDLSLVIRNPQGAIMAYSRPVQIVVTSAGTGAFDDAAVEIVSPPISLVPGEASATGVVQTIRVTNLGTSTWQPSTHALRLMPVQRMALSTRTISLPSAVAPGARVDLTVTISCNGSGLGGFSAQMNNSRTMFGQLTAHSLRCSP